MLLGDPDYSDRGHIERNLRSFCRRSIFNTNTCQGEHSVAGQNIIKHLAITGFENAQRHHGLGKQNCVPQGHCRHKRRNINFEICHTLKLIDTAKPQKVKQPKPMRAGDEAITRRTCRRCKRTKGLPGFLLSRLSPRGWQDPSVCRGQALRSHQSVCQLT